MITIYKKNTIPKNIDIITMNDIYFNKNTVEQLNDDAKHIIELIDNSEMINKYNIKSKFQGEVINIDKLSTGCKTTLNILYNPDVIFDIRECGENALDVIYSLPKGKVYCDYPLISFDFDKVIIDDKAGTKEITDYEELKEWWLSEN